MNLKPIVQGIGSVLNAALVSRLKARAIASVVARIAERRRQARDHAVVRTRISKQDDAR